MGSQKFLRNFHMKSINATVSFFQISAYLKWCSSNHVLFNHINE